MQRHLNKNSDPEVRWNKAFKAATMVDPAKWQGKTPLKFKVSKRGYKFGN